MKRLCTMLALCAALGAVNATAATASDASSSQATSSDPNFRWHNGQWWYWQAPQSRWMVWDGSQWQVHQPRRATRSYSYYQDAGPTQGFGTPSARRAGGRITNSFGHRDAGSKIRGQY